MPTLNKVSCILYLVSCTFSSTSSVDRNFLHSVMKVSRMGHLVSSNALHYVNICSIVSGFCWHSIQVGSTGTWLKAALLLCDVGTGYQFQPCVDTRDIPCPVDLLYKWVFLARPVVISCKVLQ